MKRAARWFFMFVVVLSVVGCSFENEYKDGTRVMRRVPVVHNMFRIGSVFLEHELKDNSYRAKWEMITNCNVCH